MLDNDERLVSIIPPVAETYAYYAVQQEGSYVIVRSPVLAWGLVETYYSSEEQEEGHPFDQRIEQSVCPVIVDDGRPSWMRSNEGLVHIGGVDGEEGLYEMTDFLNRHGQLLTTSEAIFGKEVARP